MKGAHPFDSGPTGSGHFGLPPQQPRPSSRLRASGSGSHGPRGAPQPTAAEAALRIARDAYSRAAQVEPLFAPHAETMLQQRGPLGEGGMGVVFRVEDRRLGREAALKLLNPQLVNAETRGRFLREARLMARLDHPSIPPVYEAGQTSDGRLYLLMRVIEGATLKERVRDAREAGRLRQERRALLEILLKVAEAVAYAHSQGIIHRDIKPSNIMLGSFGEVFLMDWGIARDLEDQLDDRPSAPALEQLAARGDGSLTQSDSLLGTPGYMSPEQARGDTTDERADIFSLGVVLTELIAGESPIPGTTAAARVASVGDGRIFRPEQLARGLPGDLCSLAGAALAFDPRERLESAARFVTELRRFLDGEPLSLHRYSLTERIVRGARQRPGVILGVAGLAACLAASGFVVAERQRSEARDAALQAERERQQASAARAQAAEAAAEAQRAFAEAEAERAQRLEAEAREQRVKAEEETRRREDEEAARRLAESQAQRVRQQMLRFSQARELTRRGAPIEQIRGAVQAALANSERDDGSLLSGAQILDEAGDPKSASILLEECARKHPPAYPALFMLHRIELRAGDEPFRITRALTRIVETARRRGDTNEFTLFFDAMTNSATGRWQTARAQLDEAIALNPRFSGAYVNRAIIRREHLDDLEGALEDMELACAYEPGAAIPIMQRALTRMRLGDNEGALADLTAAIQLDPQLHYALNNRGAMFSSLGRWREALRDYEAASELAPNNASYHLNRARALESLDRDEESLAAVAKAEALAPRDPGPWLQRAKMAISDRDFEAAYEACQKAIALDDKSSEAYYLWSFCADAGGDLKRAIALVEKAAALEPQARYHFHIASLKYQAGDVRGGFESANTAVELAPSEGRAYGERAMGHHLLGRNDEALKDFERALEIGPRSKRLLMSRASLYERLGRFDEAISDLREALAEDPSDVSLLCQRGLVHARAGRFDAARRDLEEAIQVTPEDGQLLYNFACVWGLEASHGATPANRKRAVERGLEVLEEALRKGYPKFDLIRRDADIARLREDPRFAPMLRRYER